ncbi:MAG: YerC/YecD family TrpR-related protein [Candidatus Borkfalkia sp.]
MRAQRGGSGHLYGGRRHRGDGHARGSIRFCEERQDARSCENHWSRRYERKRGYENSLPHAPNCKTEEDCLALLSDLCTFQEQEQMAQRAAAAKLLLEGKTYAEIMDSTEISSATLSRVSRAVRHGSGGYARLIPRDGR